VPEDLLDVAQAGPVFQKMRGAGVTPHVRGDPLPDLGEPGIFGDQVIEGVAANDRFIDATTGTRDNRSSPSRTGPTTRGGDSWEKVGTTDATAISTERALNAGRASGHATADPSGAFLQDG
jgi:hypothetical protein